MAESGAVDVINETAYAECSTMCPCETIFCLRQKKCCLAVVNTFAATCPPAGCCPLAARRRLQHQGDARAIVIRAGGVVRCIHRIADAAVDMRADDDDARPAQR